MFNFKYSSFRAFSPSSVILYIPEFVFTCSSESVMAFKYIGEISGSHDGKYKNDCLLG
jgi:hypothetical protein